MPVYNRPQEVEELLESLSAQTFTNFEVIVVEDGSTDPCRSIVNRYDGRLDIRYLEKANAGPGPARNFGFARGRGEFFVSFDSDCIIPQSYFAGVEKFLQTHAVDAWGGPDAGHKSFTLMQRAMAHTMSSILTTGGIRGKESRPCKAHGACIRSL